MSSSYLARGVRRFPAFPRRLNPRRGDVHIVRLRLDTHDTIEILDGEEVKRARRFVFESDRARFIKSHVAARHVLSRCLDIAPHRLSFTRAPNGKPEVQGTTADIRFNLSHSGERALLAFAVGVEIGVDIEQERPMEALAFSHRFFAPSETRALQNVAKPDQIAAFFRCWTRKEAFVKGLGAGLSFPLTGFEVSVLDKPGQQLLSCDAMPHLLERWRVISLPSDPGYAAALATEPTGCHVTYWDGYEATGVSR